MASTKQRRRVCIVILTVLLAVLLAVLGYLLYMRYSGETERDSSAYVDAEAKDWDTGIDTSDDTEGRILIPGYTKAEMNTGDTVLKLRIGNPKENTCYLKAVLKLEDGSVLYESGLLEPGTGFDEIELNQTLEAGEYEAFVHYQGYTLEDSKELNSSDSAFTLTVNP